jgi:hypothetical protein
MTSDAKAPPADGAPADTGVANGNGAPPPGQEQSGGAEPTPEELRSQLAEARQSDRTRGQRIRELSEELEALKRTAMSEQERAIADAVEQARQEVDGTWHQRYLTLRIERAAATRLADPSDAVRLLDLSGLTPDSTEAEIGALLDELLTAKPYLAPPHNNGSAPQLDRGPQGNGPATGTDMNALLRSRARGQ